MIEYVKNNNVVYKVMRDSYYARNNDNNKK